MNKLFFLMLLFGIASAASYGILTNTFAVIVQQLGVFHTDDVGLVGCFDSMTGLRIVIPDYVLCPDGPPGPLPPPP